MSSVFCTHTWTLDHVSSVSLQWKTGCGVECKDICLFQCHGQSLFKYVGVDRFLKQKYQCNILLFCLRLQPCADASLPFSWSLGSICSSCVLYRCPLKHSLSNRKGVKWLEGEIFRAELCSNIELLLQGTESTKEWSTKVKKLVL